EQQGQLGHLRHLRLKVEHAALGVDADRDQVGREVEYLVLRFAAVGLGGQCVVVRDEVEAFVLLLQLDPVLGRTQVVPEVETPCGAQDRKSTRLNSSHVAISYA